jgi:hypothetical protein
LQALSGVTNLLAHLALYDRSASSDVRHSTVCIGSGMCVRRRSVRLSALGLVGGDTVKRSGGSVRRDHGELLRDHANLPSPAHTSALIRESLRDTRAACPVSETNERRPPTYRSMAKMVGKPLATVWRALNRRGSVTLTEAYRRERFAVVCANRFYRRWSIRQIAADLRVSRGAVERDLRVAAVMQRHGWSPEEITRQALHDAIAARAERDRMREARR